MEENARFLWSGYFSLKNKEDIMITWNNLDTLDSYKELSKASRVNLAEVMSGENGAERVKNYSIPMAEGFTYNYAAKAVDDDVLDALVKLAKEAQLAEKFKALYNGEVVNTGEKRLVLHHMTRGQLGDTVTADGVDKRAFYVEQQEKIADFANNPFPIGQTQQELSHCNRKAMNHVDTTYVPTLVLFPAIDIACWLNDNRFAASVTALHH